MPEWDRVPLGEVLRLRKEFITIDDLTEYMRCRVQVRAQGIVLRDKVPGSAIKTKKQQVCRAGEFLVAEIDAKMGGFGLVPSALDGSVVSSHYFLFEIDESKLDRDFLDLYSKTPEFMEQVSAQGSTNYAAIRPAHVLGYTMPLPPLPEQQRIVARIKSMLEKVDEIQRLKVDALSHTLSIPSSHLTQLTIHREKWPEANIADVVVSIDSGWSPQCEKRVTKPGEWGVLRTTSVQWQNFQPLENKALPKGLGFREELTVKSGDVLVTRAGPRNRVGVAAHANEDYPTLMISDKIIRLRPNPEKIISEFLCLVLLSELTQTYITYRKTGLADAQVNISQKILLDAPLFLPSLETQRMIVNNWASQQERYLRLRALQESTQRELDALPASILVRAFAGEL